MNKEKNIIAFILAGGSGTRLAPLSLNFGDKLPKQFLNILSDKTMLQETIDLFPEEIAKVIIGEEKFAKTTEELIGEQAEIISEPFGCNTAIAIGLGAIYALNKTGDKNTVIFFKPSDHYIKKEHFAPYFMAACEKAKEGKIVTLGIKPSRPETGLGYIKIKSQIPNPNVKSSSNDQNSEINVFNIEQFVEKPDFEKAKEFVESGRFYWNGGMFAFTAGFILDKLKTHSPEIYESLMEIKKTFDARGDDPMWSPEIKEKILEQYKLIKEQGKNISIDYAIMEKESDNILMVEVEKKLEWDDIGLWIALEKYLEPNEHGNRVKGDNVSIDNCQNCLVLNYVGHWSLGLGHLRDLLVVNTSNGILICPKSSSIRAKDIVEDLKEGKKLIEIDSKNNKVKNETDLPVCLVDMSGLEIEVSDRKINIRYNNKF